VFLGRDFSSSQDYSEEVAALIDSEIHDIIANAYDVAKNVLCEHIDKLHFIAEFLLKNEVMDADQFRATMERDEVTIEEIEKIVADKKAKSIADNEQKAKENAEKQAQEDAEKAQGDVGGLKLIDTDAVEETPTEANVDEAEPSEETNTEVESDKENTEE
jgi:cell division protease FtsH